MKKIFLAMIGIIISTSVIAGCGNNSKTGDKTAANQVEKNDKNKIDLKNVNKIDGIMEYTFTEIKADKKIEPAVKKDFSTYYEAKKEGAKYIDFMMEVKNLKNEKVEIDDVMKSNIKIDGKEYNTFTVIEDKCGGEFKYANITPIDPLANTTVHILSEIPESELNKDIELTMKIDKKDYKVTFKLENVVPEKKFVKLGDTLTSEGFSQVKLASLEFKKRINPSNPKSFYTYYEVKDTSKIYLVLGVDVKNIKDTKLKADEVLGIRVTYDNKYKYDASPIIEEAGGGDFDYANITSIDPLTTSKMYYMCEVPQEVKDGKVEVEISINGAKYYLNK